MQTVESEIKPLESEIKYYKPEIFICIKAIHIDIEVMF